MIQKTILITGCSEGGLGDALARALSRRSHHVIATARNPSKMQHFKALNIETLPLDVLSSESIDECVSAVAAKTGGSLDMLINNSGGGYSMPLTDVSIPEARKLFDLNVWAVLAVTQAFLPLLLRPEHGGMVVNNTSVAAVLPNPFAGIYSASKAAAAMITDNLRLELKPFGIKVVDLRTGVVKSNFFNNQEGGATPVLPANSIYMPGREAVEKTMRGDPFKESGFLSADKWAEQVAGDLSASKPSGRIWRGGSAWLVWFFKGLLPFWATDSLVEKITGLDVVKTKLAQMNAKQA